MKTLTAFQMALLLLCFSETVARSEDSAALCFKATAESVEACAEHLAKADSVEQKYFWLTLRGRAWESKGREDKASADYSAALALRSEMVQVKQNGHVACKAFRYVQLIAKASGARARLLVEEGIENEECFELRKGTKVKAGPGWLFRPFQARNRIWWVYDQAFRTELEEEDLLAGYEELNDKIVKAQKNESRKLPEQQQTPTLDQPRISLPAWMPLPVEKPSESARFIAAPEQLFEDVKTAVWAVVAKGTSGQIVQGSAVAVGPTHLLTNCHVAAGALEIMLVQGSQSRTALLGAADVATDRCIIEVRIPLSQYVQGVKSFDRLKIGERVYTVGSPRGLEHTFGEGLVSGKRNVAHARLVQTSAPISPGSSGGALFDLYGNLVGITTFMLKESQALNFAIAADDFWR